MFAAAALGLIIAAGATAPRTEPFAGRLWTDDDGLPQNSILSMAPGPEGTLWLGTQLGAFEFDGTSFFPLLRGADNLAYVTAMLEGRQGGRWLGTARGEVLQSLGHGDFFPMFVRQDRDGKDFVQAAKDPPAVTALVEGPAGIVWIATTKGLASPGSLALSYPKGLEGQSLRALLRTRDGTVWVAGERLTVRNRFGGWSPVPALDGQDVTALYQDRSGAVWYGTGSGSIGKLDAKLSLSMSSTVRGRSAVRAFLEDRSGTFWVGTASGLFILRDGRLEATQALPALATTPVLSLLEDREDNVWVGTDGGLFRLRRTALWALEPLPGHRRTSVTSISGEDQHRVWLGTNGTGLIALRDGQVERRYTTVDGLAEDGVNSVVADGKGGAWVGLMTRGVQHLSGGAFQRPAALRQLAKTSVFALYIDRRTRLWIGTLKQGLYVLEGAQLSHLGKADGLRDDTVYALEESADGRMWVGTPKGLSVVRDHAVLAPPDINATVLALHEDRDGVLWIGTYKAGLQWLTPDGAPLQPALKSDVLDSIIYAVLEDESSGRLWMSGIHGLFSARKASLRDFASGRAHSVEVAHLGKMDGMVSAEANGGSQPAGWRSLDGRLWFSTVAGPVVVDPAVYAALPVPGAPGIRLDGALADGDAVSLQGAAVPRGRGELELRYHGISLTAPEDVRYRYRLEGLDSEWREAGPETKARYTSLPPGKYSFRVQASRGGAWSTEAVTGDIQLLPHFTETYPFKGLMVAALGALAWAIHWARTRALLARAAVLAERNRLAREIHDGLTQSLTGILIQLEAALRRWGGAAEGSKEHVERARDWARLSLSETRSAVAALRQSIGSTEALAAALQRAGEALTSGTAVRFDVTSAGNEALPAELGEALLRIGQEALTNALRHGKPGSVEIRVEAKDSRVRLLVRDDGKGFDPEAVGPWGTGLRGMRERAGAAGASIDVRSRPGGPTEVEATAPLSGKEAVVRRSPVGPAGAR